ncbi:hypothetical protein BH10BAC3_BH10BAC3_25100 [soil metagenome]
MIHIVFQEADVATLKKAQELDETLAGDIHHIKDDYAVGPLNELNRPEGWQARRDWWRMLLETGGDYNVEETLGMVDDKMTVHQLITALKNNEEEIVWIWAAQNKHDVSGYYWLMSQLPDYQGRIFILYLNNLPFINDKGGIFYPTNLHEIQPKEFLKAKKLARLVTLSEFEIDPDEWKRICSENKIVRLLEGGKKLAQADEDYYDANIVKYVSGDFQKANRILQQYYSKEKETTADIFMLWRLKKLAGDKDWEIKGDIAKSSKDFEIRDTNIISKKKSTAETIDIR